jgi:ABC-type transport system involved in multi-copper enzyme maturation permease subunit
MKTGVLLGIELIKTVKRRAFWVALAFLTLMSGVTIISSLLQGRRGMSAPFVPPYSWAMTAADVGPMPSFFLAITIVMLVTSEFTWRTARQNVIDGLSKEQFFAAKWLMVMMVAIAFVGMPFAMATGTALYGRLTTAAPASATKPDAVAVKPDSAAQAAEREALESFQKALAVARTGADSARIVERRRADSTVKALGQAIRDVRTQRPRAIYPPPDPGAPLVSIGDLKVAGGYLLASLGFAAMAFMLAILLRSTGGAIGVFFLYFAFLEQLIGLMLRRFGSVELAGKVMPYMPMNVLRAPTNPNVWHAAYVERANAIAVSIGQPAQVVEADLWKLIGLPLAWIAVFLLVTFLVFRRRDL